MPRVLDELAEVFHGIRGNPTPREITKSARLADQFDGSPTPEGWNALRRGLPCPLPPMRMDPVGSWTLPDGFATVWDIAAFVAATHPDWDSPDERSSEAWEAAQIFAGVREVLADIGCLDPAAIHRSSRLTADLGLE